MTDELAIAAPAILPPKPHWIGFDLGGTKILSVAFDDKFEVLSRRRRKTKGSEGSKAGVERIIETIRQTLEEGAVPLDQLSGIGIGCPGLVDLDKGHILDSANLGWKNVTARGSRSGVSLPSAGD